jgi:hypothetical protein
MIVPILTTLILRQLISDVSQTSWEVFVVDDCFILDLGPIIPTK